MTNQVTQQWGSLSKTWKWITTVSAGIASIVGAYFAVMGMAAVMDTWVVSEVEAQESNQATIEVLQALKGQIDQETRQREIEDLVTQLQRIDFQIMYLNNLSERNPDQQFQLETLRMNQGQLRIRLGFLRCIASDRPINECQQQ